METGSYRQDGDSTVRKGSHFFFLSSPFSTGKYGEGYKEGTMTRKKFASKVKVYKSLPELTTAEDRKSRPFLRRLYRPVCHTSVETSLYRIN